MKNIRPRKSLAIGSKKVQPRRTSKLGDTVVKHLKGDQKTFRHEIKEDSALIKKIKKGKKRK